MSARFVATAALCLLALTGCGTPSAGMPSPRGPAAELVVVPLAASPQAPERPPAPLRPVDRLDQSPPVQLDVPAIGLSTRRVVDLGVDAGGVLQMPPDAATAGWSVSGPTPGASGPAVLAAHIDLDGTPGLFARIADLAPGDEVGVHRADGEEAVFAVYRVARFPKTAFPADDVYADTAGPELRLISLGGVFDRGDGRHLDNVVVFARLVGAR